MSTRSLTIVRNPEGNTLLTLYKQSDGYPRHYGYYLAKLLAQVRMTHGLIQDRNLGHSANGLGCLAAQIVAKLKDAAGEVYLVPEWDETNMYTRFVYIITTQEDHLTVKALEHTVGGNTDRKNIFEGTVKDFKVFCKKASDRDRARLRRQQKRTAAERA